MRVTTAMVERAADSLHRDFALETVDAARAALEAALADIPDPGVLEGPAGVEKYLTATRRCFELEAAHVEQHRRIAELEAKLDKVRTWAAYVPGINAGLLAILDGKEDP